MAKVKANAASAALLAGPTVYTRADALNEASFEISNVETTTPEVLREQILEAIRTAASSNRLESCHLRQTSGPINTSHANWIAVRNLLRDPPFDFTFTVRANGGGPGVPDVEAKWAI